MYILSNFTVKRFLDIILLLLFKDMFSAKKKKPSKFTF